MGSRIDSEGGRNRHCEEMVREGEKDMRGGGKGEGEGAGEGEEERKTEQE